MVTMALDHVRDYFHYGSFFTDPTNLETTTPFYFSPALLHIIALPYLFFLTGTSAFLYGRKKSKPELSRISVHSRYLVDCS